MIKLKDILIESVVDVHQTIGDFSKGSSFTDKRDRALITNPVAIQKVRDFFKNTSAAFDFYFVNTKEARKFTEIGKVSEDFIFNELKIKTEQLQNGRINKDHITVFFTNNKGSEKIPLTPWIIAHRFGHVIRRDYVWKEEYAPWIERKLGEILQDYGIIKTDRYDRKYLIAKRHLCEEIGTFKSARDKNLREEFEFDYEVFAQYLKSGRVAFNPLPDALLSGHAAFGRKQYNRLKDRENAMASLAELQNDFEYYAENVLSNAIGNIYVM